ncbi:hypothetical protein G8V03_09530 [Clostridium botulinum D/C]|uniref:hypothetical protein n=1 Tax=Clostridium botulinum TaxID=1491 RepID=UPI001E3F12B2|nr:hypothetical protein [Clostridium botulinum]MCD3351228.1 hypothetical protein [Clostridium botulinum D/C]MCD3360185.1 hypothetical protein [Clostridium botulinum D/C]MCD3361712.1 hypothetical protein [Clostridium botulinum D/C]MCD3365990.1 hypothetical protein [Clostridium botulinum D/C]
MTLEEISEKISKLQEIKDILLKPMPDNPTLEEIIYKSYLELESVTKVMKKINDLGYRKIKKGTEIKYVTNDISDILTSKNVDVEEDLKNLVQKIFKKNKKGAIKSWF